MASEEVQDENDIIRVADEIERYFRNHPAAVDSVEGIAKWWIPYQRFYEATDLIQEALEYLVACGRIFRRINPDGVAVYASADRRRL